jgi:ATP-binding cassette subfamily B protein
MCPSGTLECKKDTLSHIDLTVEPGEKLSIVGLNGAGKTTLMKPLCGLLDPTGDQVLLNGEGIRQFNRRDYYTLFSTVFQDFSVFGTTLADNVLQDPECTDLAGMENALKRAGLWEKYQSTSQGEKTYIDTGIYTDGIQLPGGELQRLMLARALYKDGPIIVLDEPTAALDPVAEMEVYQNFDKIVGDKTAVYISHHLSSCKFCDELAVFDHGKIFQ